jgi:hypothetical protein
MFPIIKIGKDDTHEVIEVRNEEDKIKKICRCQLKEKHINEDDTVSFPVYECPKMTGKFGFGTETGLPQ